MKKFYAVIGNPPYQEETESDSTRMLPIYDKFMEEAYKCGERVELITPARFLFNAGFTSKEWNRKMLSDEHFKVLLYEPNSSAIFPNVDLKGGVSITYRNSQETYGAIEMFIPYQEMNSIYKKVVRDNDSFVGLSTIICPRDLLHYSEKLFNDYPEYKKMNNNNNVVNTNAFEKFPEIFADKCFDNSVPVIGRIKSGRVTRYIRKEYIEDNPFIDVYKLIIPEVNGSGVFGEQMAPSLEGERGIAFTDTFICIGKFSTKKEIQSTAKYIQTKFARAMLGLLKKTQHNTAEKWAFVPIQDFTETSDIDWTKSLHDIDVQLYRKYELDEREILFIESQVKEMI